MSPAKTKKALPRPTLIGRTSPRRVPVYIGAGLLDRLGELIPGATEGRLLALVSDQTVFSLYGAHLARALTRAGWRVDSVVLKPGESVKSAHTISQLHDLWFKAGYDRSTPVVALGGGTIGDAVGYAAATFLRGLPLWQVPSTIVGQVDSAIGGKVGINHARGKNLIGCFYQPAGVVIDPSLLISLPARERRSGLAEVIKYGVIAAPALFARCESHVVPWCDGDAEFDADTIRRCVKIKLSVVERDESDHGLRHILNFGHTLGHAFERWGNYRRLRHGEAVTLGMIAAGRIALNRRTFRREQFARLCAVCRALAPTLPRLSFQPKDVVPFLATDKKRKAGRQVWVLPTRIGKVAMVDDVTDNEIRDAITFVSRWLREG